MTESMLWVAEALESLSAEQRAAYLDFLKEMKASAEA